MYNIFRQTCERVLRIPVDPEPPPGDEGSAQVFRAAPNFYTYLLFIWALKATALVVFSLFPIIAPIFFAGEVIRKGGTAGWFLLLIPVVVVIVEVGFILFTLAMVRLDYEKRWYVVTDRSLRVREGVVAIREMTVTFANIQNISISQGPLQRLLGIADLRVDTAGGSGGTTKHGQRLGQNLHTAWFRGVNNAHQVRELIQKRLRQFKDSGLGDHEELAAAPSHFPATPELVPVLRELCIEARALREVVSARRV